MSRRRPVPLERVVKGCVYEYHFELRKPGDPPLQCIASMNDHGRPFFIDLRSGDAYFGDRGNLYLLGTVVLTVME